MALAKQLKLMIACVVGSVTVMGIAGCSEETQQALSSLVSTVVSTVIDLLEQGVTGCYHPTFAGAQSSQFGCGLLSSTGDVLFDQYLIEEVATQRFYFNDYQTEINVFDECSPNQMNAYATADGQVLMGWYMMGNLFSKYRSALPIAGVLAHEMGHRLQFENGWMVQTEPTDRRTELEADMWSGLYMAFAKTYSGSEIRSYFQAVFDSGDYNFNRPDHHGTRNQRLAAAAVGFDVADRIRSGRTPLSFSAIHQVFLQEVSRITSSVGFIPTESLGETKGEAVTSDPSVTQILDGIDRGWIDGILNGERSLVEKGALLIPYEDRLSLVPYH